ncbi:hypothetical protein [Citrobacter amalonaticus]|uniref:hypothetical protein n=1 Tax=Citrobacter amalonaticus TaxID=35703 RepID=UPI00207CD1C5|nr:hypothetical protein [Citrobacter amalonaticus]MCO4156919.1 hypothetical protein [Citrobacter amalonaticus]
MLTLDKMRSELRKQCSITAGQDGEKYAIQWLKKSNWKFECVEQGTNTISSKLQEYGGKRPDYIIDADNSTYILLDAKYHSTEECTSFTLTDCEIGKYRALHQYLTNACSDCTFEVVFMVFPKEKDGDEFTFVSLNEFNKGECTTLVSKVATKISLLNRDNLWVNS